MKKAQLCEFGKEIETEEECKDALAHVYLLGITLQSRKSLVSGSYDDIPFQCSYQSNGDQAFYFNKKEVSNAKGFPSGEYKMICKKGKI